MGNAGRKLRSGRNGGESTGKGHCGKNGGGGGRPESARRGSGVSRRERREQGIPLPPDILTDEEIEDITVSTGNTMLSGDFFCFFLKRQRRVGRGMMMIVVRANGEAREERLW